MFTRLYIVVSWWNWISVLSVSSTDSRQIIVILLVMLLSTMRHTIMVNNTDDHNKNNIATFKTTNEDLDVQPCDCHSICVGNLVSNAIPRCKSDCNSERGMSNKYNVLVQQNL